MSKHKQKGLTLIELLVAMVISLVVALAAVAALVVSRQGFTSIDAESQLRENSRFIVEVFQRLIAQTGFQDVDFAATGVPPPTQGVDVNPVPNIYGLNNSSRAKNDTWDAGSPRNSSNVPGYGSDILVIRFQAANAPWNTASGVKADGAMIDCAGELPSAPPTNKYDRIISILHVGIGNDGEPALMCSRSATGDAPYDTQPLISGVENFQVLYGVDGIGPGNTAPATSVDSIPERYLRADQITVSGNETATYANWRQVRSVRIGIVLRGAVGSAIDRSSGQKFYPLGNGKNAASDAAGSAFNSADDKGTEFSPGNDGRLRQVVNFTVHLRNAQVDKSS